MLHAELTSRIIGCFYEVYNILGPGFLEKVYENALIIALNRKGCQCQQQKPIQVYFEGQLVGEFFADLVVNGAVIVELKAAKTLREEHECQLINYLKAAQFEVGLLLNFGDCVQFRRKIFSNDRKYALPKRTKQDPKI